MLSSLPTAQFFQEKDLKLLKGEAIKDEKCDEKDMRKKRIEKKKQPEQPEKDQRQREKEASKLKEKRSLQKQVLFMENFLKRSKTSHSFQDDQFSTKSVTCDPSITKSKNVYKLTTLSMDSTLATSSDITLEDIRKSHVSLWHHLGQSFRSKRKQGWGIRLKPKSEPFTELKLADTTGVAHYDDLAMEKPVDGFGEHNCDIRSYPTNEDSSYLVAKKCCRGKQLLQFHNSYRPAFYGIWSKKSQVVGPRHPIRKDPSLDYASSSDEEWFEEEPGEILSDCEEDKESSVEFSKSDDENDDGFFVRDGYLSEDEVDKVIDVEGAESSRSCKDDTESEEFSDLIQRQKNLNNLTVHALKKDQPLIILDLMHGKELGQNFSGTLKLEQMYLKSLSMRAIPGSLCIELSMDEMLDEDQEARLSPGGGASTSREKEHV
ncbi:chromatin assembly factor 1 subunit FAS1-like isoform X2 [Gastrolobium bilobum]|uniref:chromatin assembly factor 1 subunit FAS1-like isoform X2 n=1 Tax=Gastrolobium bilobum TaxID=150636 RepID=UPI002AB2F190|nr:chromatin assembly factor 1 subunit FAS1-like isoform X2 [Gastrolobium bilobum]